MSAETLLLFIMTEILFCLSPGPAVLVTVSHAIGGGVRSSLGPIAGINAGNLLWYAIAATGLAALAQSSETAFTVIRWAGIIYLLWIGISMLRSKEGAVRANKGEKNNFRKGFFSGLAVHMSNPKALLFFAAFLPQFIDPAANVPQQFAILAAVTLIVEFIILIGWAWLAARAAQLTIRSDSVQWIDRISGGVLISVALGLAFLKPFRG